MVSDEGMTATRTAQCGFGLIDLSGRKVECERNVLIS
jgi:hypothetical protein